MLAEVTLHIPDVLVDFFMVIFIAFCLLAGLAFLIEVFMWLFYPSN